MSAPAAPPVTAVSPDGAAQALFAEARRRRRRRRLAGIASAVVACAVVAVAAVTWLPRPPGHGAGRTRPAGASLTAVAPGVAAWYDGTLLHVGRIHLDGRVTEQAGPQVFEDLVPLVPAGGRVYWADPVGGYSSALRRWSHLVRYLDLATGKTGIAGPGQTVFPSADGRYLFASQTATSLTETPIAGGHPRSLTLPHGWYLPDPDGLPGAGAYGLATANGIVVQSARRPGRRALTVALWNPGSGRVKALGKARAVIGAYTGPGARYSLLAWLTARCPAPGNCLLAITNTATWATRTVRSPLPDGFAAGGAFSPDGSRLAVFPQAAPQGMSPGYARLALADVGTGAMRMAVRPRIALGQDLAWARWLPGGAHLIVGAGMVGYLVTAATLAARPLVVPPGRGSQAINWTVAIAPSAGR
jgi:hypothetical protein